MQILKSFLIDQLGGRGYCIRRSVKYCQGSDNERHWLLAALILRRLGTVIMIEAFQAR